MAKSKYKKGPMDSIKKNKVSISIISILVILGLVVFLTAEKESNQVYLYGDDVIEMTYFHWTQCPHCIKQNSFNSRVIEKEYPNVKIIEYEITNPATNVKYKEMAANYEGLDPERFPGTPLTIIGDEYNVGYGDDSTTGQVLIEMIEKEQAKIDANWDEATMKTTVEVREQANN
jgi:hypothetical protein